MREVALRLTQPEFVEKAGAGLRFVLELVQGKKTLRLDKVNQILQLFGHEMEPVKSSLPSTEKVGANEKGRNKNARCYCGLALPE